MSVDQVPATDVAAASIAAVLMDAAGHTAEALPVLLRMIRAGPRFEQRLRPRLDEVAHCLASALDAVLIASADAERAGIGAPRRAGEQALTILLTDYLDRNGK